MTATVVLSKALDYINTFKVLLYLIFLSEMKDAVSLQIYVIFI
jgi:hypothetical protein